MKRGRREVLVLGAAGLAAAAAGFLVGPTLLRRADKEESGTGTRALPAAGLVDLAGHTRRLSEWHDRVLICNFWATWCAPCREEIPLLLATRSKYAFAGVEIVGIAIDNPTKVRDFAASFNISYPILLAEANGLDLMRQLGNSAGGLPYTVVTDRRGNVVHRKLGAFQEADLDEVLRPLARA